MAVVKRGDPGGVGPYDLFDISEFADKDPNTIPLDEFRFYLQAKEHNAQAAIRIAGRLEKGRPADTVDKFVEGQKYDELLTALPSIYEFQQTEIQTFKDRNPGFKETQENAEILATFTRKHVTQDPNLPVTASDLQLGYDKLRGQGVLDE